MQILGNNNISRHVFEKYGDERDKGVMLFSGQ